MTFPGVFQKARKIFLITGGIAVILLIPLSIYLAFLARELPSLEQLEHYDPRLTTTLLSSDGKVIKELFVQRRSYIPLEKIPDEMIQAVLVTEDRQFYSHWGMNVGRTIRALLIDLFSLSIRQGASTLTQQLARNLYLTPEQTVSRKLKEAMTAIQIERTYSKPEILEMYLTHIYFGHGAYGVESAAQRYFSKSATQLTLEECALLAAQLKAPSHYSPLQKPDAAKGRRDLILSFLRNAGTIDEARYERAVNSPLKLKPNPYDDARSVGAYFSEMVRINLEKMGDEYGFDYYHDGLTVYTTIDSRLQAIAEKSVSVQLKTLQNKFTPRFYRREAPRLVQAKFPQLNSFERANLLADSAFIDSVYQAQSAIQVAFVALDPTTGAILALIGGRDFVESKFNRAVQAVRQPGSAFKPFVYTAAIDNGYPPTYRLLNQDVVVEQYDGKKWAPDNYDHSRGGLTTLREGLKRSLNLVTVRLIQEIVKPADVIRYARQMGIRSNLDAVDALALGACGVIPLDLTAAYGVYANRGVLCDPFSIGRISNRNGDVVYNHAPQRKVALSEQTAYIMSDMLKTVVIHGTGASSRSVYGFLRPAGGKTGTTNEYTDAWFIGFTPQIVAGVWVGLDDPAVSLGSNQSGAVAALPIWATFMKDAYDVLGWDEVDFTMPDGIVRLDICEESYKKATEYCPQVISELFRSEDAPQETCPIHRGGLRHMKW
jgi:penicillin-binding protein 1A